MPEDDGAGLAGDGMTLPEAKTLVQRVATARRPHFVGIAGTGMSSLATLMADMGKSVSGSDAGGEAVLDWLSARGIQVQRGHHPENLDGADLVVYSAAVPPENQELCVARERGLTVISHAQALGALMDTRRGIAVAGTHGKSTITALIAHVLSIAGRDPTLVGGAEAIDFAASSRLGKGSELVAEADEYDRRFLHLHPEVAIITSIQPDHLDYYRDLDDIVDAFRDFVEGMRRDGLVVSCEDDPLLARLELKRPRLRYGCSPLADWQLRNYQPLPGGGCRFTMIDPGHSAREYHLRLSGKHNAQNALAAIVVCSVLGVDNNVVRAGLASFQGTRRRFETKHRAGGIWIVDDYAHHPPAVLATLSAAREVHAGRIVAVFQPHTAHRTAALLEDFADAFQHADEVLVTPIYLPEGRKNGDVNVSATDLVARIRHPPARYVASLEDALAELQPKLRPGVLILTLGAGDITELADHLSEEAARMNARAGQASTRAMTGDFGLAAGEAGE